MTHAMFWKTLFDFALVVLAVLSVIFEKRLIDFEKRVGRAVRRRIRSRKEAQRAAAADLHRAEPLRAASRPTSPAAPRPCPAMPSPHRVA